MAGWAETEQVDETSLPGAPGPRERRGARLQRRWLFALILVLAAVPRIVLGTRPGLWADEIFSLGMATGHGLEHPATDAQPALGDYVEPRGAVPASAFRAYTQHDAGAHVPPESTEPGRVLRAVLLSDTSPPLYYLLLAAWTHVAGTSDAALRLFSAACALACLPFLWLIGCQLTGAEPTPARGMAPAWIACVLFAVSPPALYYAGEGRMYALTWLLGLTLMWSTLALRERGPRMPLLLLWVGAGTAGLLTHYFFAFGWLAAVVWLLMYPGRMRRSHVIAAAILTGVLILPWYLQVPASLHRWRVTGGWLNYPLERRQIVTQPILLVWSMISGGGIWNTPDTTVWGRRLALLLYALLTLAVVRRGLARLLAPQRLLMWLWLAAGVAGPVVFDALRRTDASLNPRYAFPALPAALLLLAVLISMLPRAMWSAYLVLLLVAWWPGLQDVFSQPSRPWEPYPIIADHLDRWASAAPGPNSDVIIVQSIPSGVIGVTRYLHAPTPVASWVVQLGERSVPADAMLLTAGRCRVAFVKVHSLVLPSPARTWLDQHATLERRDRLSPDASIWYYTLGPSATATGSALGCDARRVAQ